MSQIYREARAQVKKKKAFYRHLSVYLSVTAFLMAINLLTFRDSRELWFFFPAVSWGVAVLIQYLNTFGFPGNKALTDEWEEEQLEKEMEKIRRKKGLEYEYEEDPLDLSDLGMEKEYARPRYERDENF